MKIYSVSMLGLCGYCKYISKEYLTLPYIIIKFLPFSVTSEVIQIFKNHTTQLNFLSFIFPGKEEEAAKWAREEEEAQRRLEENRLRMEEEAARLRQEEEERKRKELELQRHKELMRQRQQQQEALRRLQQQQQQQQLAQMKVKLGTSPEVLLANVLGRCWQ